MTSISLEGNIGCGKTTQLKILEGQKYKVFKEPIEKWPLDAFYQDPSRWGFLLQVVVLRTYYQDAGLSIHERSPLSSKEIFWKNLVDSKVVTELEDRVYADEYEDKGWEPDVMIFIDKSPEMCKKHINNRAQPGDEDMDLSYLVSVDKYYHEMYKNFRGDKYKIDGSKCVQSIHKEIKDIVSKYE